MPPASPLPASPPPDSPVAAPRVKSVLPFDILRILIRLAKGWKSLLVIAFLGGAAAGAAGWFTLRSKYTVQVQLVRRELPNTFAASQIGEAFRPREFASATIMSLMVSSSVLEKTGAELDPPVDGTTLLRRIELLPDKNTELITVAYTSRESPQKAAEEVNLYAHNVIKLIEDLQAQEARELLAFLSDQATRTEASLNEAEEKLQVFTKESGLTDPSREIDTILRQIGDLDLKIEMAGISRETTAFRKVYIEKELARLSPAMQRLQEAKDRLKELLAQFTDRNPLVVEQQAKVKALEVSMAKPGSPDGFQPTGNTLANDLYLDLVHIYGEQDTAVTEDQKLQAFRATLQARLSTMPDKLVLSARLRGQVTSLETTRDLLAGRRREAQLFAEKALGYYRIFAEATPESMEKAGRARKILLLAIGGSIFFTGLTMAIRALRGALDDTLVSPSDLRRTVGLPVAAMLPPVENMDPGTLSRWRFSTWSEIVRLSAPPPDGALVAGFVSAAPAEGKSTWLAHLSTAALERGLKVLQVSCGSPGQDGEATASPLGDALRDPEKVLERIRQSQPPSLELRAEPGFGWTPEWRALWRRALEIWSREPALALLVELPPASEMDSLLLAETLPALFWLSESGRLRRRDLTPVLKTISLSGLPLTASLLNRVPPIFLKLPDLAKFGLCLAAGFLLMPQQARAQGTQPPAAPASPALTAPPVPAPEAPMSLDGHTSLLPDSPPAPSLTTAPPENPAAAAPQEGPALLPGDVPPSTSPLPEEVPAAANPKGSAPASAEAKPPLLPAPLKPSLPPPPANPRLAPWQQELTLGPGDLVNLQVYGYKQYSRNEVPIGPDGCLTYLQVIGFKAEGLTVDQLRDGLTKALNAYLPNARVIVVPAAWRSKKYFVLGTVVERGVYTLDRPMTLMEAAARARGIETGLLDQSTVEIADMKRAFLVRGGKKLPVDFARLFYDGDMSQNVALQPGDYIYFPSNTLNEVYVLGSVGNPGSLGVSQNLTAIGAITIRGGFSRSAWKKKVLIVRGSLEKPSVIVVDAAAILSGKQRDIPLEPLDIVYVTDKPWKYAAEVLDVAVQSFVQSAASSWVGDKVQSFIGASPNHN